jgi:DNA-binding NtrC family response regulator
VYLPAAEGADADEVPPTTVTRASTGTESILLVEDDAAVRIVTARILRNAGYTVIEAENAVAALALCDNGRRFDLLITDMVMPGMAGRDLAARVLERRPGVKTLIMSGYTRDGMIHRSSLPAGVMFIEKPLTAEGLSTTVRQILDGVSG